MTAHQDPDVCSACRGTGTGPRFVEGRREPCDLCDGSGHIVTCLNSGAGNPHCNGTLPAPEAETEGEYCGPCRKWLDVPQAAE